VKKSEKKYKKVFSTFPDAGPDSHSVKYDMLSTKDNLTLQFPHFVVCSDPRNLVESDE